MSQPNVTPVWNKLTREYDYVEEPKVIGHIEIPDYKKPTNHFRCDECGGIVQAHQTHQVRTKYKGFPDKVDNVCNYCYNELVEGISDEEGERMFMMAESQNRELTEDERLIYSL